MCNIRKNFQTTKFISKNFLRWLVSGFLPCWTGHSIGFIIWWLQPIILNVRYDNFFKLPNLFCCVGWTRTIDLQVMSLTSYHCYYHAILCGDDETRTRVLQRTNNTSISHVYSIIHNWQIYNFLSIKLSNWMVLLFGRSRKDNYQKHILIFTFFLKSHDVYGRD